MKLTGPVTFIHINKYSKTETSRILLLTQLFDDGTSCHTSLSPILPLLIVPQIPLKHIQT